jgi:putative modified peptide
MFERDARAAFEAAGYVHADESAAHPAFCLSVSTLAPKADIARDRAKLKSALNSIHGCMAPKEMHACPKGDMMMAGIVPAVIHLM